MSIKSHFKQALRYTGNKIISSVLDRLFLIFLLSAMKYINYIIIFLMVEHDLLYFL